jgi:hypothetical protein
LQSSGLVDALPLFYILERHAAVSMIVKQALPCEMLSLYAARRLNAAEMEEREQLRRSTACDIDFLCSELERCKGKCAWESAGSNGEMTYVQAFFLHVEHQHWQMLKRISLLHQRR